MDYYKTVEKIKTLLLTTDLTMFEIADALDCDENLVEDVMEELEEGEVQ
jgi:hypothetical protein